MNMYRYSDELRDAANTIVDSISRRSQVPSLGSKGSDETDNVRHNPTLFLEVIFRIHGQILKSPEIF
jgi:hypothetical protein